MLLVSAELFMSKICLVVPKWEGSIDGDDENDSNGENQSWSLATGTRRKTTKKNTQSTVTPIIVKRNVMDKTKMQVPDFIFDSDENMELDEQEEQGVQDQGLQEVKAQVVTHQPVIG